MSTSAKLLWGLVLFSSGVLRELLAVASSHVPVGQEKYVNTLHTPPSTRSAHPDKAHTDRHTVSPPVYFYCSSLPPFSPSCHCITEVKKKEKRSLSFYSISLSRKVKLFFFIAVKRIEVLLKQIRTICHFLFPVPSQFTCDCSTIWSRPIYSRLSPLPPCSLKVTLGEIFGRGVLRLLCQCEALRWHGYQ